MGKSSLLVSVFLASIYCVIAAGPPSGFTGVRGKKSIPDSAYSEPTQTIEEAVSSGQAEVDRTDHDVDMNPNAIGGMVDKRAPSGFLGMRGKKPIGEWVSAPQAEYSMGYFKRAPSGFLGMRGKKENYFVEEYDKRAPSGFFGMRGKKDFDLIPDSYDVYNDKRAPSGFFGMRGKKEYDPFFEDVKRAPSSGFFGMRGKKQPGRSGFFGMRGKKYPYEFRGKFVGVRGKKMSNEVNGPDYSQSVDEQLQNLGDGLDLNQLMLLLTENESWEPTRNGNDYPGEQSQVQI